MAEIMSTKAEVSLQKEEQRKQLKNTGEFVLTEAEVSLQKEEERKQLKSTGEFVSTEGEVSLQKEEERKQLKSTEEFVSTETEVNMTQVKQEKQFEIVSVEVEVSSIKVKEENNLTNTREITSTEPKEILQQPKRKKLLKNIGKTTSTEAKVSEQQPKRKKRTLTEAVEDSLNQVKQEKKQRGADRRVSKRKCGKSPSNLKVPRQPSANYCQVFNPTIDVKIERFNEFGDEVGSNLDNMSSFKKNELDSDEESIAEDYQISPAVLPDYLDPYVTEKIQSVDRADDQQLCKMVPPDQLSFDWHSDPKVFTGCREEFTGASGPTFPLTEMKPLDVFLKIWDDQILDFIIKQTNSYAAKELEKMTLKNSSRFLSWKPIDRNELLLFFALNIFHGLVPLGLEQDYFKVSGFLAMPDLAHLMTYNRFIQIKKFLNFNDVTTMAPDTTVDQHHLNNIQPLTSHLNAKFKELYMPGQNIVIDESLMHLSGRLSFSQKVSNKITKGEMKSYELYEASTGYLWNFYIYDSARRRLTARQSSKNEQSDQEGINVVQPERITTSKIVFDLITPLAERGHTLVLDSLYNSPLLARYLKAKKIDVLGTLRVSRQYVPDSIRTLSQGEMKVGEVAHSHTHDLTVFLWRDSNLVCLISTYHRVGTEAKDTSSRWKCKPDAVLEYNQLMAGVDKKDHLLSVHPMERSRNQMWYKKLFRRLLNVSLMNSYIIYSYKDSNITQREFRTALAEALVGIYRPEPVHTVEVSAILRRIISRPNTSNLSRPKLLYNHYIVKGPSRHALCVWCKMSGKRTRTIYKCDQCEVSLCIEMCFKEYHT